MGEAIFKREFSPAEYREFSIRLEDQLGRLREVIRADAFNRWEPTIGAELEVYLADTEYAPAPVNEALLSMANHPQLTPELNQYNLEFNLSPVAAQGAAFGAIEKELREFLNTLQGHANSIGAQVIPIGILPTLQNKHLSVDYMTDRDRYHALNNGLTRVRKGGFHIDIAGEDHLSLHGEGVTVEGANTSFQVHLQVPGDQFAMRFNAAQLTAPLVLAMAANSPLIAGCKLWQESRIALFKQSIDMRQRVNADWRPPSRVNFGHGWCRHDAWELFAANVALFQPLIPRLSDEADEGPVPVFPELCLHHGTIWPWNRPVYSHLGGGHLRIEFRSLPAGPTVLDMIANAALCIGWSLGLGESIDQYAARLPFQFAEYNFYRAAQQGMDAKMIWPRKHKGGLEERPVTELIEEFLPRARQGLDLLDLDSADVDRLWQIIEERFDTRQTGAQWQLQTFNKYRESCDVGESCRRMLSDYVENISQSQPVARWC
ncbi:MAG: glutamate--cysteine ligase [Halieaceae bacterium]|jgi:gamma-glutamyl:cysteine ligase YbdK (ATP-grasp superfamily)|nr:glutamate--cysteine ligase [Halieaceae bacterium]